MTTTKKLAIAVVALSLVLVGVIGGTLAYLVAQSNTVTNTFTYGKIEIELWENTVDENGNFTDTKDSDGIEYLNVVPGDTINKNPTVTVKSGSEACFVYALVTNNLVSTANDPVAPVATIHINSGWIAIGTVGNSTLYRFTDQAKTPGDYEVFEKVTFNSALKAEDIATLNAISAPIVIKAYAHQADNTNVSVADTAANTWAGTTPISQP